jgi:hypothetical protein
MLEIVSCTCWISVHIIGRNVYLDPLSMLNWGMCPFVIELFKFFIFWRQISYKIYDLKMFSPIWWAVFSDS